MAPAPVRNDSVAILLCTYLGEVFLPQQLDSIAQQTHSQWTIWASDDSPDDNTDTHALLSAYRQRWGHDRLILRDGPRRGYAANFLSLLNDRSIDTAFYAYVDQDDIWMADKLQRALAFLNTVPTETPALYCSRTQLVDASNITLGLSPRFSRPPAFANALVQCIGGGNTMVFNRALCELLREASEAGDIDVVAHDWWTYLVASGCGGIVHYDVEPTVRYRQHPTNQMGSNRRLAAQQTRIRKLFSGDFKQWNGRNLDALHTLRHRLTADSQRTLDAFAAARQGNVLSRLASFKRSGVYRQTLLGNAGLWAAVLFNKL